MKKNLKIKYFSIICTLSLLIQFNLALGKASISSLNPISIQGQMYSKNSEQWEDTEYDFFLVQCAYKESMNLSLAYEGTLDLDLAIFFDEIAIDGPQENNAWDIAHCGFDETINTPKGYSSKKGLNTSEIGLEEIFYANFDYETPRNIYILVYADAGIGNCTYLLNSTLNMTYISQGDYNRCWTVWQAWGIFAIGSIIIIIIFSRWVKKSTLTAEQKAEIAQKELEKEKQLSQKGVASKKAKSSMQARKGNQRR